MPIMTHLLLAVLIIGSLHMSAYAGELDKDYAYDDDDVARSPANIEKTTAAPMVPYFDQDQVVVYVHPNESSVKLDCPVKNYDAANHVILWFRNDTVLTNGNQAITDIYVLDKQFGLTAPWANATGHVFSCRIMPADVRRYISFKMGTPPTETPNSAASLSWPTGVNCLVLGALLLIRRF